MAAFKEWLEPQVRDAVVQMYKKGYATQSSGFDAQDQALQLIDGLFNIDNEGGVQLTCTVFKVTQFKKHMHINEIQPPPCRACRTVRRPSGALGGASNMRP